MINPCPLCGHDKPYVHIRAGFGGYQQIGCDKCKLTLRVEDDGSPHADQQAALIAVWNRREELP